MLSPMPLISAILQTHNDALRVGRTLETLHPCDEILVIDRDSTDRTVQIARDWGCRICDSKFAIADAVALAKHDWLLLLNPTESITEGLEATLFEWRIRPIEEVRTIPACTISVRQETASGWSEGRPETRLIPNTWSQWADLMPAPHPQSFLLQGDLLRFLTP